MDFNELNNNSYAPYSGFPAIAVVESSEGTYFLGCRIENISYPLSIDAIQSALFCCLSEGHHPKNLLVSDPERETTSFWEQEYDLTIDTFNADDIHDFDFGDVLLNQNIDINQILDDLLDHAVVQESNFPVSALVETEQGFFSGVNIECSSWNMGLCAERVAIAKALTYGSTKLKKLHIHTREGEFSSPCGACRQVILEHMPNRQIHLHHADHSESIHFSNDLLPHSFRSSSLSNSNN